MVMKALLVIDKCKKEKIIWSSLFFLLLKKCITIQHLIKVHQHHRDHHNTNTKQNELGDRYCHEDTNDTAGNRNDAHDSNGDKGFDSRSIHNFLHKIMLNLIQIVIFVSSYSY